MPIRPTPRPNEIQSLISWWPAYFDPHVGHPAFALPLLQSLTYIFLNSLISPKVCLGDGSKLVLRPVCFCS